MNAQISITKSTIGKGWVFRFVAEDGYQLTANSEIFRYKKDARKAANKLFKAWYA